MIKYLVWSTYTDAEEEFWLHGLQKQWSQLLNAYVKRKPLTQGWFIHLKYKNSYKREVLPDNTIQQLERETILYHTTLTTQQNRRTPTSPIDIQQSTASKATTMRPTSETDEQQSTVKNEFYIIEEFFRQICKIHFKRQFYVPQSCSCTSHLLDKGFN